MNKHYAARNLRDALFCELQYTCENDGKLTAMVMEEWLALATAGQMLGMNFSRVDQCSDFHHQTDFSGFRLSGYECGWIPEIILFYSDRMLNGKIFVGRHQKETFRYRLLFLTDQGYCVFFVNRSS